MDRRRMAVVMGVLALVFLFCAATLAAGAEPQVGQTLGNVKFPKPMSDEAAKYLGLGKVATFSLQDIKALYVLVEQMITTCPYCVAQAPVLNELYNLINQDAAFEGKLKFMALGKGSDETTMKTWKAFHKVPFPMIADPSGIFAKALNFPNYPVTLVLDKSGKIVWVHVGAFSDAKEAFNNIKTAVK